MTSTPAGAGALLMYRATRRRRRRRVAAAVVMLATAGAGVYLGLPAVVDVALTGAAVVCAVSARIGTLRDADRWRRGADGERRTAELLDALSARRWAVWHDLRVPGSRANIDHLVVGRTGIWVVDTKAPRAQVRPGWRSVRFGDRKLDTGPVMWEAEVVARRLERVFGAAMPVRPIVAVHGGPLPARGVRVGGVRVVTAEQVAGHIRRGRRRLARGDVPLVCRAVEEGLA